MNTRLRAKAYHTRVVDVAVETVVVYIACGQSQPARQSASSGPQKGCSSGSLRRAQEDIDTPTDFYHRVLPLVGVQRGLEERILEIKNGGQGHLQLDGSVRA